MRKKNTVVVLIALVVLVGFGMYYFKPYLLPINSGVVWWLKNVVSEREQILLDFVNDKLTDEKGGIKTNYTEENSDGDITKGSSVLSESEGLMLIYYLHRGK